MPKIKVLVVDDSVVIRKMVSSMLGEDPDIEVVGIAANGSIALQKVNQVQPDLITMDIEMPVMDGITTVREIRKSHKTIPIIMYSTLTEKGAKATLDALTAGASDYVTKPANVGSVEEGMKRLKEELIPKVKSLCKGRTEAVETIREELPKIHPKPKAPATQCLLPSKVEMVCIGSSTGGPKALDVLFSGLPGNFPVPIAVVQHMPPKFTAILAERLSDTMELNFFEGDDGMKMEAGSVYIAPGGRHMDFVLKGKDKFIKLTDEPPENSCRPAVDVFFRSAAQQMGDKLLAVILTGMGQDGYRGCEFIREAGGQVVAQDKETSVVWGMPGYVAEGGLAHAVLPLQEIADDVLDRVRKSGVHF